MKIKYILLFTAIVSIFSLTLQAQDQKVTVKMQEKSVKEVLESIESQSNFRFFYNESLINVNRKLTLNKEAVTINSLLSELFLNTDVSFEYKGNVIVLSNKNIEEKKTIKGQVKDDKGQTLPGVNVLEIGTLNGVTSDMSGNYTITVSRGEARIRFSFIGFLNEEEQVGNRAEINVGLIPDITLLDEFVVVGRSIGAVARKRMAGSIFNIGAM